MKLEKYDYIIQLTLTEHSKDLPAWQKVKQIPSFILPSLLGLLTIENVKKVIFEMFEKYEIHGTIENSTGEIAML